MPVKPSPDPSGRAVVGLDLGTTNVKAVLLDAAGRTLGTSSVPVTLNRPGPGAVEQDLDEIWNATLECLRQTVAAAPGAGVRALGISSQGGALQVLDPTGRPRGPLISWLDQRGAPENDAALRQLGRDWFRARLGHGRSGMAIGQARRLRHEPGPGLTDRDRVGFAGDCIVERLTGRAAHDATSAGLTLLYNPHRNDYDPDVLALAGIAREQLPALVSPRTPAGGLLPDVARRVGLPPGIPVSPAVHDQYAAALGCGALDPGDVMFGAGTAWVLLAITDCLPEPVLDEAYTCRHVVPGRFGQILSLVNGGSAISWALELVGASGLRGRALDDLLDAAPPGAGGLRCRPFLASSGPGLASPATRGLLAQIELHHRPAHVVRAVLEGLACELNRHLDLLRRAGPPVRTLIMAGGAASSRVTPGIVADVTGVPVACLESAEGSARGAALLGRLLAEPETGWKEASREWAPPARTVEPGSRVADYRAVYARYLEWLPP